MPGDYDYYTTGRRPAGRRLLAGLILLLVVVGAAGLAWKYSGWQGPSLFHRATGEDDGSNAASPAPAASTTAENPAPPPANEATAAALPSALPPSAQQAPAQQAAPVSDEAIDTRMMDLEQRVVRVSVAAQAASGYANRAEAMMVAFAARRRLDAGAPLEFIEPQLRLLFGDAQPKAVATIINAASDPVTINKLRAGLEDIKLRMEEGDPEQGWFASTMRTLGSLAKLHSADKPDVQPEQRLARARRSVEAGQIEDAIDQMAKLPAQPTITQWLEQARRYNEAHRALDVIEAAAILEPRTAPLVAPAVQAAPAKK